MGEPNINSRCPPPKLGESLQISTLELWSASAPLWRRQGWKIAGVRVVVREFPHRTLNPWSREMQERISETW